MTNTELVLNMLAEASVKDISEAVNPKTFQAGKKVVTALNAKTTLLLNAGKENKKGKK